MVEWAEKMNAIQRTALALFEAKGEVEFSIGGFDDERMADLLAMELLKGLSGATASQVRQVLRRAEFWLDATTRLDCAATSFQQADEALLRAYGEEVAQRQE